MDLAKTAPGDGAARTGSSVREPLQLMKPMRAAQKKARKAGKPGTRPSLRLPPERTAGASAASASGALRTSPRTAFFPSFGVRWRLAQQSTPAGGKAMPGLAGSGIGRRDRRQLGTGSRSHAAGPPRRAAAQTMADRHASGQSTTGISTTTSTNSPSASTGAALSDLCVGFTQVLLRGYFPGLQHPPFSSQRRQPR